MEAGGARWGFSDHLWVPSSPTGVVFDHRCCISVQQICAATLSGVCRGAFASTAGQEVSDQQQHAVKRGTVKHGDKGVKGGGAVSGPFYTWVAVQVG